jgi:hypothetical protein
VARGEQELSTAKRGNTSLGSVRLPAWVVPHRSHEGYLMISLAADQTFRVDIARIHNMPVIVSTYESCTLRAHTAF